jgi:dipeptidase
MRGRHFVLQIFGICVAALLAAAFSSQNTSRTIEPSLDPRVGGGCTSIMVGREATTDGSVITSHTCDGFYRTWMAVSPHRVNPSGASEKIYLGRRYRPVNPDDVENLEVTGEIPEAAESYAFLDTAYPCMNEHQLAIGESTLFTKEELRDTEKGLFEIEEIQRLMLERCRTAREAIRLADDLTKRYGYRGYFGECLTIADPKEVWHFEIVGATSKYVGAVWAAARIPDGHVGVSANFPRIGELDLDNPDYFMASENVYSLAEEMGWWDSGSGKPFKFYEAYGNRSKNVSDREWRVLSLAAPSLNLDPDADEIPFSVEAEYKVSVRDVIAWFRDTYENTRFDPTQKLIVTNRKGTKFVSPVASPWMSWYMENLLNTLKPGSVPGVYVIPNNTCSYSTVIQLRDWLPDPVGGIVWLNFDNPAHSARMPFFCGITGLPAHFKVCGQDRFTTESALWAFRRVSRLAGVNWGASRQLVESLIQECEDQAFTELPGIEKKALELYENEPESAKVFLTSYCGNFAQAVTQRFWDLGDQIWTLFGRDFLFTPEQLKSIR